MSPEPCHADKCNTCVDESSCQHYCHSYADISDRINDEAAEWPGLTRQEARALVDRVAELEGRDFRLAEARDAERRRAEQAETEVQRQREQIERVRAFHPRENHMTGKVCGSCRDAYEEPLPWPCPTIVALDGEAVNTDAS